MLHLKKNLFWWDPARGQCAHKIVIWGVKKRAKNQFLRFFKIVKKTYKIKIFSGSAMIT